MRNRSSHWGVGGTQDLLEGGPHSVDGYVTKGSVAVKVQAEVGIGEYQGTLPRVLHSSSPEG